jgi:hypothetical protein
MKYKDFYKYLLEATVPFEKHDRIKTGLNKKYGDNSYGLGEFGIELEFIIDDGTLPYKYYQEPEEQVEERPIGDIIKDFLDDANAIEGALQSHFQSSDVRSIIESHKHSGEIRSLFSPTVKSDYFMFLDEFEGTRYSQLGSVDVLLDKSYEDVEKEFGRHAEFLPKVNLAIAAKDLYKEELESIIDDIQEGKPQTKILANYIKDNFSYSDIRRLPSSKSFFIRYLIDYIRDETDIETTFTYTPGVDGDYMQDIVDLFTSDVSTNTRFYYYQILGGGLNMIKNNLENIHLK